MADQRLQNSKRKHYLEVSPTKSPGESLQSDTNLSDGANDRSKSNTTMPGSSSDTVTSPYETNKVDANKRNNEEKSIETMCANFSDVAKEETENFYFANIKIKKEISDEPHSPVSDNTPMIPTRSRWKLYNRRTRGVSSASSNFGSSDARKTKSEPIVIELSDSEEDVSNHPSRTAGIEGEIIRKLSRIGFRKQTNIPSYKEDNSDSSSEDEKRRRKRRTKPKKKIAYQASSSKNKRYLQEGQVRVKGFRLKTHRRHKASNTFAPVTRANTKAKNKFLLGSTSQRFSRRLEIIKPTHSKRSMSLREKRNQNFKVAIENNSSETETVSQDKRTMKNSYVKDGLVAHNNKKPTRSDPDELETDVSEDIKKINETSYVESDSAVTSDCKKIHKPNSNYATVVIQDFKKMSKIEFSESETVLTPDSKKVLKSNSSDSETAISQSSKKNIKINLSESELASNQNSKRNNSSEAGAVQESKKSAKYKSSKSNCSETVATQDSEKITLNYCSDSGTVVSVPLDKLERKPSSTSEISSSETVNTSSLAGNEIDEKSRSEDDSQQSKGKKKKAPHEEKDETVVRKRGRPKLNDNKLKAIKKSPVVVDQSQPPFLQDAFCFDPNYKLGLPKCRECRMAAHRNSKKMQNSYCRFLEYRKLCFDKLGNIQTAGFSRPSEATQEHLKLWLPQTDKPPQDLNRDTSKALLEHIGDQFCDLIEQEKEAQLLHVGTDNNITWKRIVQEVREMCDVCDTTIFNMHWVCPVCGLAVCIDCYKMRKQGITIKDEESRSRDRDDYKWLLCNRQPHVQESLVMAQIIPGNALWLMQKLLHEVRNEWSIPAYCKCIPPETNSSEKKISTGICKQLMCFVTKTFSSERNRSSDFSNAFNNVNIKTELNYGDLDVEVGDTAMRWLEESNFHFYGSSYSPVCGSNQAYHDSEDFSSFREMLLQDANLDRYGQESDRAFAPFSTNEIIECMTNSDFKEKDGSEKSMLKHFSHRLPQASSGRDPLPIRIYTNIESNLAFSDVSHSWLCNGRLLLLNQPQHKNNLTLFQEQWKRGQPILVKGVDQRLDMTLWHPDSFCQDFGEVKNDLVDCKTGKVLKNIPMKRFWEGFENFNKRMVDDETDEYMLLKLKDWPPGEDFSELLPQRFQDLMKGLPLPEYTHRNGILNLAGRLPSWFVRPDLGPKMYNAYGSALYPTKGTTNLHLDISDAVNVMVYVGIPGDGNNTQHIQAALKAIDEGGCDSLMRDRVRKNDAKPGALWHIYNARDTDKIRDMLTKVAIEQGEKLEANHDPIHDQSWYIDTNLRKRLYQEYGVEGYAIAQCLGDAVFIPAGAPHQVRNLHSCVKVAEDFVSPENIAHCFKLTQEFRHLSDTHTNHEDKLQIKNIIYHVVRDALAHLMESNEAAGNTENVSTK